MGNQCSINILYNYFLGVATEGAQHPSIFQIIVGCFRSLSLFPLRTPRSCEAFQKQNSHA